VVTMTAAAEATMTAGAVATIATENYRGRGSSFVFIGNKSDGRRWNRY
jgi:hypothetical protein